MEKLELKEKLLDGIFRGKILLTGDAHNRIIFEDDYGIGESKFKKNLDDLLDEQGVKAILDTGDIGYGYDESDLYVGFDDMAGQEIMGGSMFIIHDLWKLITNYNKDEIRKNIANRMKASEVSKNCPYLILHGHQHIRGVENVPNLPKGSFEGRKKLEVIPEKSELVINQPGTYLINPGRLDRGEVAVLDVQDIGDYRVALYNVPMK